MGIAKKMWSHVIPATNVSIPGINQNKGVQLPRKPYAKGHIHSYFSGLTCHGVSNVNYSHSYTQHSSLVVEGCHPNKNQHIIHVVLVPRLSSSTCGLMQTAKIQVLGSLLSLLSTLTRVRYILHTMMATGRNRVDTTTYRVRACRVHTPIGVRLPCNRRNLLYA